MIAKVDPERKQVFGWAYVAADADGNVIVDKQGDMIEAEELEKAAYGFVVDARSGDVMHNGVKVADMIESCVFTPEKVQKMGLPPMPTAWWIGMQVTDDRVWPLVSPPDGSPPVLKMFSIGGRGRREAVEL